MALTRAKLEELIAAGEIEVGGGGVNANILHNWDFRNPVNQRGVSGTISSAGYFYDRWFAYSTGSLTINPGYVACAKNIEQRIEGLGLAGKVATFSMMVDDVVYAKTLTFPSTTGSVSSSADMPTAIIFAHDTTDMRVRINGQSTGLNYQAFKLELGTVSTLHLDPPMDHAVELSKCQRFGLPVKGRFSGGQNGTSAWLFVPTPVEMRIVPTYIGPGSVNYYAGSGSTLYTASITDIREKSASGILVMMAAETSLSRVPITNTSVSFEFFASSDL